MLSRAPYVCPQSLLQAASCGPPTTMAVVGANDFISVESARLAAEAGLIEPVLIGQPDDISRAADECAWDITGVRIEPGGDEAECARIAAHLARSGEVQSLMKGRVHTDTLMKAVLNKEARLRTETRISHAFHMTIPGREGSLIITDAAVNIAPDVAQRLDILRNAVSMMHALGNRRPKIAVLSATEQPNPAMPSSMDARAICERAQREIMDIDIAGPLALDNAISPEAARIKGIDSIVAGRAQVLLVPNIETGNALFKAMVYFLSATAAGVVLGAKVPMVLTSRADPPQARLASAALASVVARHIR